MAISEHMDEAEEDEGKKCKSCVNTKISDQMRPCLTQDMG
jgi:hypothetical protein